MLWTVQQDHTADDPRAIIARLRKEKRWPYRKIGTEIAKVLNDPKQRINGSTLSRIAKGESGVSERTRKGLIALHEKYPPRETGFAESPVEPLTGAPEGRPRQLGPGQSIWRVREGKALPPGYQTGDYFIVDQNLRPINDKDHILVTVEGGKTLLGIYQRGWFIPPNPDTEDMQQLDGDNVAFMGIVTERWRAMR